MIVNGANAKAAALKVNKRDAVEAAARVTPEKVPPIQSVSRLFPILRGGKPLRAIWISFQEKCVLCGIRTEALRLAAWATYCRVIHNARAPRQRPRGSSFPWFSAPIKGQNQLLADTGVVPGHHSSLLRSTVLSLSGCGTIIFRAAIGSSFSEA